MQRQVCHSLTPDTAVDSPLDALETTVDSQRIETWIEANPTQEQRLLVDGARESLATFVDRAERSVDRGHTVHDSAPVPIECSDAPCFRVRVVAPAERGVYEAEDARAGIRLRNA